MNYFTRPNLIRGYCSARDKDWSAPELEVAGRQFADTRYDKTRDAPAKVIRKALGRCTKREDSKSPQQTAATTRATHLVAQQEPLTPGLNFFGQKGFGPGSHGKNYYQASQNKGQKGKGKWQPGNGNWGGKGKEQGNQRAMNLTQFSREIECCQVDDPNGVAVPVATRTLCPFEGLPGGCSRNKGKGGETCKFNRARHPQTFSAHRSPTIGQTLQQLERWRERNGARRRRIQNTRGNGP